MSKFLQILAVGCLLFVMFAPQAYADDDNLDARFWQKAAVQQRYTDYVNRIGEKGQCTAQWVSISKNRCVTYTQWGEISEDGIKISTSEFHTLQLGDGQQLQRSPDSRRLYITEDLGNGYMRLGYIEDPGVDIVFDSEANTYKLALAVQFSFLLTQYKNIAFSNNSYYMIGETANNTLTRTALTDFSIKILSSNNPSISVAQTERWGISTNGNLVVGANGQNEMVAYELGFCDTGKAPNICNAKKISTAQTMNAPGDKIYISDDGRSVSLYSSPQGLRTSRISLNLDYESLNRPVTYVALGDSFSSGEGAWWYENNTDGDNGFTKEKCHQSSSSYAEQYARKYRRWSDEYYEPNLEGAMVIRKSNYINATCSGAQSIHVQSFDLKYKTSANLQNDYPGQFEQTEKWVPQDRKNFYLDALINNHPGRARQIEFLEKYKPTIATIGIGGNDVGFSGALEACLASIKTCPHASSKKASEGYKIRNEFKLLNALFEEMQRASPETRYFAVGYPKIIADDDYVCGTNVLLDAWEREYVKRSTQYLNQVIKTAAARNGFGYIDFEGTIGSQGLCGSGLGVNGLSLGNDKKEVTLLNKTYAVFANESFHPTEYGQLLLADRLIDGYGELDVAEYPTCTKDAEGICSKSWINAPSIPSYFNAPNSDRSVIYKSFTSTVTAGSIPIQIGNFLKNSRVTLTIFSEPYVLGTLSANNEGELAQNITLPSFIEPGYHTLYLEGIDDEDNPVEYQQVFLYLPDDTKLGPCSFLPYSNLDQDEDGIDDACDPEIGVENPLTFADPSEYLTYPNPERKRPVMAQTNFTDQSPAVPATPITASSANVSKTSFVLGIQSQDADVFKEAATPIFQTANSVPNTRVSKSNQSTNTESASTQNPLALYLSALVVLIAGGVLGWMYFGRKPSHNN